MAVRYKVVAGILAILLASPASAQSIVVLESYAGQRPDDASYLLAPLMSELAGRGYVTGVHDIATKVHSLVSRPGLTLSETEYSETATIVENGYGAFLSLDMATAVEQLSYGLARLLRSPATLAQDQTRRDTLYKALVGLALAQGRLRRTEEALRTMGELVRSFPDREFYRALYGPEAQGIYLKAKRELEEQGRGTLVVNVDDDNVVIFINERFAGVGTFRSDALVPGLYRIYLQKGSQPGRVRTVEVAPGKTTDVKLSWELDAALRTNDFAGFVFSNEAARSRLEMDAAVQLAQRIESAGVVLVGIRNVAGRRSIVGKVINLSGKRVERTASLVIDPPVGAEQIRGLARYLAGETPIPELVLPEAPSPSVETQDVRDEPEIPSRPFRIWKWVAPSVGLALVGLGAHWISVHGDSQYGPEGNLLPQRRNTLGQGIAVASIGAVLVGAGIYLWVRDARDQARVRAIVGPSSDSEGNVGASLWITGSY